MADPKPSVAFDPVPVIAAELSLPPRGVAAVVQLLSEGATVPFIARYRKEMTGELDEVQIRNIEERRAYVLDLEDRRRTVLSSIEEQGKLTDSLRARVLAASSKQELEDLYLPYKPKRRTKAAIARERGLEPLALRILAQPREGDPTKEAAAFVDEAKEVADIAGALAGARDIVAETIAEDAAIRSLVRDAFHDEGVLCSKMADGKDATPTKFDLYKDFQERVATIPSHRFLAVRRGEAEGVLRVSLDIDVERLTARIEDKAGLNRASPFAAELVAAVKDSYKRLLAPSVETDVRVDLKMRSDRGAIEVFAENLRNVLLASPLGARPVVGIDPGLRTGCKCVAVDGTGRFLTNVTIYPARGSTAEREARDVLLALIEKHRPVAVAVGNGTGGREVEAFLRKVLVDAGMKEMIVTPVNEAGASVYSASDIAREEFPDLDLTVRGAISIARRLQDPLAELVKLDPKAIGVGQYQHDVHQPLLMRKLGEVVESCVNHVGVDLNTASAPLLSHVAGIGEGLAKKIVKHREDKGCFDDRKQLLAVSGLGPKTFEQAAGFLRVHGVHPLDASGVHPERYKLVERMAKDLGTELSELVGNAALVDAIDVKRYVSDEVGEPTLRDILAELKKPGRDPRQTFEPPRFRDDVNTLEDLQVGMQLEGVVTNVTAFGAFVDVGVHQDGLVHISQLADRFVQNPHDVVKPGDKLKVRVLEVDLQRRRIALTAKKEPVATAAPRPKGDDDQRRDRPRGGPPKAPPPKQASFSNNPFAKLGQGGNEEKRPRR